MERKKDTTSIRTYLPPYYKRLTVALSRYTQIPESRIVSDAVKEKFDRIPIEEREKILKHHNE